MSRNNFQPVFEESETAIRDRMIAKVEADGWRAEPGDFMYDAVAPGPTEIKQIQINQDTILASRFARHAEGIDLNDCLYDVGLERLGATANKRALSITADAGVAIKAGQMFFAVVLDDQGQPLQFTTDSAVTWATNGSITLNIICNTLGTIGNLTTGSQFVLQPPIPGVRTIVDLGNTVLARDIETDEDAWKRYDFKVTHPDTGGNKNDLVRWAKEVAGVGKAKCVPRWNGVNTSKVLLVGNDFKPATAQVVADGQAYIDPAAAGLGEGKAPMGNSCTVVAADNLAINVIVTGIQYAPGAIQNEVRAAFLASLESHLNSLVFETDPLTKAPLAVNYNKIFGLLTFTPGVSNFTSLTINGAKVDISVSATQAPTVGTVTGV
ncbi:baseplate J/gp47 family protein [Paenibacillus sp. L3-i20]|uniref:baseplate J/gp47 family protein n=1 Tax=Paenibacillus sp. L3-i20 TaxID=2905833 RepID=UPI001EDF75F2|nr:baseplate J/gp47 family protein [Paenibacillus sp. L3-i20]GKU79282.1 phage tail protein [Paenibacillus sp. L3-i20]